jgi:hypothetical protein
MISRVTWLLLSILPHLALADNTFPAHIGGSPWSFADIDEPSDTFVVNDADSSTIDVYLFREQGPIVIDVPIRRYVAPTDADGHLANVAELISRGIVTANALIQLPAYDVDEGVTPVYDCDGDGILDALVGELDEVYLNKEKIGAMRGSNAVWFSNSFTVPIEKLKFPAQPGDTAVNSFVVEVDVGNRDIVLSSGAIGCEVWAVTVDWLALRFDAAAPVLLIHGIRSSGAVFETFQQGLTANYVTSDASINLSDPPAPDPLPTGCADIPYNNTITYNVEQLETLLPEIAERYGTDTIHFVTHSKGGLDSLGFLSRTIAAPIEVTVGTMTGEPVTRDLSALSLVTLNTPHLGSVLAQYGVEARELTMSQALRTGVRPTAAKSLEGAYYCDLTPERATAFVNTAVLPNGVQTASVATDADQNADQELDGTESSGFGLDWIATTLYQILGTVADVEISVTPVDWWFDEIIVTESPTTEFLLNDAIVTQESAGRYRRYGITGWNHLNVHSDANAVEIAEDAQQPGLINWRIAQ